MTAYLALFLLIVPPAYVLFVPAFVAAYRLHPQFWPVTIITALLGWTGIGWIAALAWSCSRFNEQPSTARP